MFCISLWILRQAASKLRDTSVLLCSEASGMLNIPEKKEIKADNEQPSKLSHLPTVSLAVHVAQVVVLAGQVLLSCKSLGCPLERVDADTACTGCWAWLLLDCSSQAGRKQQEREEAQHGELQTETIIHLNVYFVNWSCSYFVFFSSECRP